VEVEHRRGCCSCRWRRRDGSGGGGDGGGDGSLGDHYTASQHGLLEEEGVGALESFRAELPRRVQRQEEREREAAAAAVAAGGGRVSPEEGA
jgi:hypothetical protein